MNDLIGYGDFLSAFFLIPIIASVFYRNRKLETTTKRFILCVLIAILASICDGLSYILDGKGVNETLLFVLNFVSYVGADLVLISFIYYGWSIISKITNIPILHAHIVTSISILDMIFLLIGSINKKLFYIENGSVIFGPWCNFVGVTAILTFLIAFVYLCARWEALSFKIISSFVIYFFLPIIAIFISLIVEGLTLTYPAVLISLLIVFINIQYDEILNSSIKEKIMEELLRTDPLTSLNNRRCYDEFVSSIEKNSDVAVMFYDLNGLKATNDMHGHKAGDELINKFKDLLLEVYDFKNIFRISGDEFVIIYTNKSKLEAESLFENFKSLIENNSSIASYGFSYGKANNINEIIRKAEKNMYASKKAYYQNTGLDRRSY